MNWSRDERLRRMLSQIHEGPIFSRWHWLTYNFSPSSSAKFLLPQSRDGGLRYVLGADGFDYFAPNVLMALDAVDQVMPGYSAQMLGRLGQIGGREKNMDDYESIVQWLAEVLVVGHLAKHLWPRKPAFRMEPASGVSKKNPEIIIELPGGGSLGVEVKCPNLGKHRELRGTRPWQVLDRSDVAGHLDGGVTLPRDNPMKDYLLHSDQKFAGFRDSSRDFRSVLFVVWDDHVQEPLAALTSNNSGLFTPQSFHRDDDNQPVIYPNVDGVVLMRHQHQFIEGMANREPLDDRDHFLDYGAHGGFPPHAYVPNPYGSELGQDWRSALDAVDRGELLGAEYSDGALITWVDVR